MTVHPGLPKTLFGFPIVYVDLKTGGRMDPTNELADRRRAEALGSGGAIKDSGTPSPSLDNAHTPNPRLMQPADVARPQASQRSPEEPPLPQASGPGPMADTNAAIAAGGEIGPAVPVDAAGKARE